MLIDKWIAEKIGLPEGEELTRETLEAWQLEKLRETVAFVLEHSSFYRDKFREARVVTSESLDKLSYNTMASLDRRNMGYINTPRSLKALSDGLVDAFGAVTLDSLEDIKSLPFTTADELAENGTRMVCVPASDVSRIVTLQQTSGTTGPPKRVWFTEDDQELMADYVHHGLPVMTGPDDVFLVLMPCEKPGSVGDVVANGVERIGTRVVRLGTIPTDGSRDDETLELMRREGVTTGLATSHTAARLAAKSADDTVIKGNMRTILLAAQYISEANKDVVEQNWECEVFEHYGSTEMGLGGAMACEKRIGYHPREADLFFEVIDPETGEVLPDGEHGEIVFTTLTRRAMPLIRYRTGDFSRWIAESCSCGSVLKRFDKVGDRSEQKAY